MARGAGCVQGLADLELGERQGEESWREVLGEAELGDPRQWVSSGDMEVATGVSSSLSKGLDWEDAAVLGVTAMVGAAARSSREGPAPALPTNQQESAGNR